MALQPLHVACGSSMTYSGACTALDSRHLAAQQAQHDDVRPARGVQPPVPGAKQPCKQRAHEARPQQPLHARLQDGVQSDAQDEHCNMSGSLPAAAAPLQPVVVSPADYMSVIG